MNDRINNPIRRRLVRWVAVAAIGVGIGAGWTWLSRPDAEPKQPLLFQRQPSAGALPVGETHEGKVVPDDLRTMFDPPGRVVFHLTSSRDTSIFVLATGVQVRGASGWESDFTVYRGEIWRLTSGVPHEVCINRPSAGTWRAYIRYGTEMKGPPLLRARLKEAWVTRSFSNWTGKAWGGGRWKGNVEVFSEQVEEP